MMCFVSLACVSAADDNSTTDVLSVDNEENNAVSVAEIADGNDNDDLSEDSQSSSSKANQTSKNSEEVLGASNDNDILGVEVYSWTTLKNQVYSANTIDIMSDCSYDGESIKISRSDLTINGHNHVLDGRKLGGIVDIYSTGSSYVKNIVFNNVIFKNGYVLGLQDTDSGSAVRLGKLVSDVTFNNCTFDSNGVNRVGGAVAARDTSSTYANLNFIDCTFINNYADSTLTTSEYFGGAAIFLHHPQNFKMTNCRFIGNYHSNKAYGGAVYMYNPRGQCEIENCIFKDNYAANHDGGAIAVGVINSGNTLIIKNCTFEGNQAKSTYKGGAISARKEIFGTFKVTNCTFRGNSAEYGGAIQTLKGTDNSNMEISDCNFIGNSARQGGGAVYAGAMKINLNTCKFEANTAPNGGAIYVDVYNRDGANIKISSSNFTNNVASTAGSSIFVVSTSKAVTIDGCQFNDVNSIHVSGAATIKDNTDIRSKDTDTYMVYVNNGGSVSLSKNNFTNVIKNYGTITTAVTATVCGNATYYLSTFEFPLNATLIDDNNNTVVSNSFKFTTTTLDQKTVIHDSRIVEDRQKADNLVTLYSYYFIDATDAGIPSMVIRPTILNIIPNVGSYTWLQTQIDNFTGDVFVLTHNVTFDPNYDLSRYNSYVIKGVNFRDGVKYNRTMSFDGNGSTISGNNQARIFDVRVQTSNSLVIRDTNFVNASTDKDGGALNVAISNLRVTDCNFTNNAARDGGAIYCSANGLTVDYCNFDKNRVSDEGASIYLKASNLVGGLTISNDNFTSNVAANSGGAIAGINGYNIVITDSNFIANQAESMYGGSIKWDNCGGVTISDSIFKDNTAASAGAIDINDGSGASIANCYFENNNATSQRGGAIVVWTTLNVELKDSIFTDNHALDETYGFGGAVFTSGSNGDYINNTFENNTAHVGGAMYFHQTNNIDLSNSTFNRNNATVDGGAVYFTGSYSKIDNVNFTYNHAGGRGGALVFLATAEGDLINSNFINNTALGDGGAVVIGGAGEVLGSKFEENTAKGFGGAIMVSEPTGFQVRDSEFRKNVAYNGGGMYISNADYCPVINSTFYYNNATHNGGAIFIITDNDDTFVDYNLFENNAQATGDGRYTWARNGYSGDSYLYLNRILLQGNLDYFINASAFAISYSSAYLTVTIPKDANNGFCKRFSCLQRYN